MNGMLDAPASQSSIKNPLLAQTEQAVEAKTPPSQKQFVDRIVTAGMTAAFSPQSHGQIFQGLDQSKDKVHDIAMGTVGLLLMLSKQSQDTMPALPMIYAGILLMLHGLDYVEQAIGVKIGTNELDKATQIMMPVLQEKLGLTHDKLQSMANNAHQNLQNPQFAQKFKESQMQPKGM